MAKKERGPRRKPITSPARPRIDPDGNPVYGAGPSPATAWIPTPAEIETIRKLAELQHTQETIAHFLGVPLRTFERRVHDLTEIRDVLERGRAAGAVSFGQVLWGHAINGNSKALGLLASRFGWGEKLALDHGDSDAVAKFGQRIAALVDRVKSEAEPGA